MDSKQKRNAALVGASVVLLGVAVYLMMRSGNTKAVPSELMQQNQQVTDELSKKTPTSPGQDVIDPALAGKGHGAKPAK